MKLTKKQIVALLISPLAAVAIACGDSDNGDSKCECPEKEHLGIDEVCCERDNCECTLKIYGWVVDDQGVEEFKFPIYRQGDVTDMENAVAKVIEAYVSLDPLSKNNLRNKIKEVRILPGNDRTRTIEDGQFIINLGEERSAASMESYFRQTADAVGDLAK